MVSLSFINPLSNEGRETLKDYGDLNQLDNEDESLIEEVIHTQNQKISDDDIIPKSYKQLALKRIQWAIEKKNNKNYSQQEFEYLFNGDLYRQDVVAFHILSQAIAMEFNITSRETRLFIESQGRLIEERLANQERPGYLLNHKENLLRKDWLKYHPPIEVKLLMIH